MNTAEKWHGTTIVLLRKNGETVVAGDGQVSLGNTVLKSKAKKVRKIESRGVIAGFAGSTADALTLFERLEAKLEKHAGNLQRAAVELAKDWRSDKFLRRLEALMAVADKKHSFIISRNRGCFRTRRWNNWNWIRWKLRISCSKSFSRNRFESRRNS